MKIRAYITHKLEENNSDCQDYFHINSKKRKIAISDGLSQSIFSAKWAQMLVKGYTESDLDDISIQLPNLQEKWLNFAQTELERLEQAGDSTWMLENCLTEKQGAAATFCGIKFTEAGRWTGYALGDSCLIEIGEDNSIQKFYPPIQIGFDNTPDYFDSFTKGKGNLLKISGMLPIGRKLFLVTDSFGELLFNKKNENLEASYVNQLLNLKSYEEFLSLVDRFRIVDNMHNDDSTIVIVENDGQSKFEVEEMTLEHLLGKDNGDIQNSSTSISTVPTECINKNVRPRNLPKHCQKCKHSGGLLNWLRKVLGQTKIMLS